MSFEIAVSYEHPLGKMVYLQNGTPVLLRTNGVWDFAEGRVIDSVSTALRHQAAEFQIERAKLHGRIQELQEVNDMLREENAGLHQRVHARALPNLGSPGHRKDRLQKNDGASRLPIPWGTPVASWADEVDAEFPPLGKGGAARKEEQS